MRWSFSTEMQPGWERLLEDTTAGVHHTPAYFQTGLLPENYDPVYAWPEGDGMRGAAVGYRSRCRISLRLWHYYFPALPAVPVGEDPADAIRTLTGSLDGRAAEIIFRGIDSPPLPEAPPGHASRDARLEYRLSLEVEEDELLARASSNHRPHMRRGEREEWRFEILSGDEGVEAVKRVQARAAKRARRKGQGFSPARPDASLRRPEEGHADWGVTVASAWKEGSLLCAAMIGWGAERAYYLSGGSTSAGYDASASFWMHYRIMRFLRKRGVRVYNLGGTPAGAADPDHEAHGLHYFKRGFGAEVVSCHGCQARLRTLHCRMHDVLSRCRESVKGVLARS